MSPEICYGVGYLIEEDDSPLNSFFATLNSFIFVFVTKPDICCRIGIKLEKLDIFKIKHLRELSLLGGKDYNF